LRLMSWIQVGSLASRMSASSNSSTQHTARQPTTAVHSASITPPSNCYRVIRARQGMR
jgi:hypothetical protein